MEESLDLVGEEMVCSDVTNASGEHQTKVAFSRDVDAGRSDCDTRLAAIGGRYSTLTDFGDWAGWVWRERRVRSAETLYLQVTPEGVFLHSSDQPDAVEFASYKYEEIEVTGELENAAISLRDKARGKNINLQPVELSEFDNCLVAIVYNTIPATEKHFHSFYYETDHIGSGSTAHVWVCRDKFTSERYAVKKIPVESGWSFEQSIREVAAMCRVNHPNVLRLYDAFLEDNQLLLVIEFMRGGELFDIISASGALSESQAQEVMKQVLSGLEALHECNIIHRDMKPENLLCTSTTWPLTVKIADFGISRDLDNASERKVTTLAGTVAFMAPEILSSRAYTSAVDIWACGCILFMMLTGTMPFPGANEVEIVHRIRDGLSFDQAVWTSGEISRAARNFIGRLLAEDPENRPTAGGALSHLWMKQVHKSQALSYDSTALSNRVTPRYVMGSRSKSTRILKGALKRAFSMGHATSTSDED